MCQCVCVCVVGEGGGDRRAVEGKTGKIEEVKKSCLQGGKVFENAAEVLFFFWLFGFFFFATDRSGTAKCKHTEHDH